MSSKVSYSYKISVKTKILNLGRRIFKIPLLEKWLVKRTFNKESSSFWCKLVPPEYLYSKNSYRTVKVNDLTFKLDISNVIDHDAFWGFHDKTISFFLSKVKKDHTVIDIGANIGIISVQSAAISKEVISIEPDKINFGCLIENLTLNDIKNVTTLNTGVGDKKDIKKLFKLVESNPGMNRIIDEELSLPFNYIQIETLDKIIGDLDLTKIDIIKIDTEGYEMKILEGAVNSINKFKPSMMLEVDNKLLQQQSSSAQQLLKYIKGKGYNIYDITNEKIIEDPEIISSPHFDIWCSP